ncbi:MAG TPA: sporulation protein YunB [Candidatus Limadaptatus stercorigallinarum]|uniref:Sporulation protein YunB n=1 Tax=Candidatus Limadaptatus stercorigallinarum TaxID=2840845 RepID=A0A9D1HUA5_9FIRM|nr:sporulation protein YunB [Candidatus Limadaptatus stercorigallinarum]
MRRDIKPRIFRIAVALTIFLAAFIFCTVYFRNNIVPTVMGSAVAEVRAICTNSVNLAVTTVVGGGLKYDDLFTVVKDSDGDVSMVQANSPEINLISREIANLAQANLDALGSQEISVPAGTFTGLALLMGMGPEVTISVIPIGSALCDFVSYFTSAGINQTLHKIYINVHAVISIVTPIDEPTITVTAEVLVAENLIVGDVPQFYFGNSIQNGGFMDLTP